MATETYSTRRVGRTPTTRSDPHRQDVPVGRCDGRRVRVLVIDPSELVRARLVGRLTEAGLDIVGQATSSALARGYARITAPDAIVLDVELADRGGLALIGELKSIAPRALLIVMTNALPYRRYCLQLGADAFLDKSADFDALAAILIQARPGIRTGS